MVSLEEVIYTHFPLVVVVTKSEICSDETFDIPTLFLNDCLSRFIPEACAQVLF